jgi:hypothetical protein
MSFLQPHEGFPPNLVCIWPLVWCQLLLLRVAVRAAYGQDARYYWSITLNLRVYLVRIDWMPGQKKECAILKPATHASGRLAAACDGRAAAPAYSVQFGNDHDSGDRLAIRRFALRRVLNLPVPET